MNQYAGDLWNGLGILGVVGHEGAAEGEAALGRGIVALARAGQPEVVASADGRAWFCSLKRQVERESTRVRAVHAMPVVMEGTLHDRAGLLARLEPGQRTQAALDDAELVRQLFLREGEAAFASLQGCYTVALYAPATRTLYLAGDLVGTRALAWQSDARRSCFGSEQKAVLVMADIQAVPNDAALAELLLGQRTGALSRGESLFAGVHVVGRGELVALRPGVVHRTRIREFDLTPHGNRPYDELCEEFHGVFRQAVRRSLHPSAPNAVTVSGGLDSSSIYCVARALQAEGEKLGPIVGLNFTADDGGLADERAYTDAITARYGPGIVRVPMQPNGFLDSLPATMRASEVPFATPSGNLFQRQYEVARDHDAATFVSGFWGDEAFNPFNYLYHLLWSLRLPSFVRVAREHHRWITESPATSAQTLAGVVRGTIRDFTPRWLRSMRLEGRATNAHLLACGRLGRALAQASHPPLAWRPGTRFAQWQRDLLDRPRTRYFLSAAAGEAGAFGLRSMHPFLDPGVVQFVLRCSGKQLNPGGRYKGLMRDALRSEVPALVLERRTKGDFTQAYGPGVARDSVDWLAGNGQDVLQRHGYLNEDGARKLSRALALNADSVDQHSNIDWQSLDTIGLASWLDTFIDRGVRHESERIECG